MANNKKPGGKHAVAAAKQHRDMERANRKNKKIAHAREMERQAEAREKKAEANAD